MSEMDDSRGIMGKKTGGNGARFDMNGVMLVVMVMVVVVVGGWFKKEIYFFFSLLPASKCCGTIG